MAEVRNSLVRFARLSALAALAATTSSCADAPELPHPEDQARLVAPLPACVTMARSRGGAALSLREEEYWELVFPSFDPKAKTLSPDARTCTGIAIGQDPTLIGGAMLHAGGAIEEGDVVIAAGGDRLRAAWLKTTVFPDGTVGGPLALVRASAQTIDLFAIGAYRGRADKTRFSIERIGSEVVVVALEDTCKGRAAGAPCDASTDVFLPRQGTLTRTAKFAVERVAYLVDSEPGVKGRFEYRLSSAPEYVRGGIRLQEQITVKDDFQREVRKAELTRSFTFGPDDTMVASDDSLWSRIVRSDKSNEPATR